MSGVLLNSLKNRLRGLTLIPGRGGCFEIRINDELIYSKLETGVFPDEAAILDTVTAWMKGKK